MQFDGFLFFLLVICLGYFAARLHLVKESAAEVLPSLLLNVCFPALLLTTFASVDGQTLLAAHCNAGVCVAAVFGVTVSVSQGGAGTARAAAVYQRHRQHLICLHPAAAAVFAGRADADRFRARRGDGSADLGIAPPAVFGQRTAQEPSAVL